MEIFTRVAKDIYGKRLPENIEPDQEIIHEMAFNLEDLTSDKGYVATPIDDFFRRSIERLEIPFKRANIFFPRSTAIPGLSLSFPNGPCLKFLASNKFKESVVEYSRILFKSPHQHFDAIETEGLEVKDLEKIAKRKPIGEEIRFRFKFPEARINMHMGYDGGLAIVNSMKAYDLRDGFKDELSLSTTIPWFREKVEIKRGLEGKTHEQAVAVAEELLERHISQFYLKL